MSNYGSNIEIIDQSHRLNCIIIHNIKRHFAILKENETFYLILGFRIREKHVMNSLKDALDDRDEVKEAITVFDQDQKGYLTKSQVENVVKNIG